MKRGLCFLGLVSFLVNCGGKVDQRQLLQKWKVEKIVSLDDSMKQTTGIKNIEAVKRFEQEGFLDFRDGLNYKARFFEIDATGGLGADLNVAVREYNGGFDVKKMPNNTLQIDLRFQDASSSLFVYELQKNRLVTGFSIGKRQGTKEFLEVTWKPN